MPIFEPFGCTFLHRGGGATPDNYKRFEIYQQSERKMGSSPFSLDQGTPYNIYEIIEDTFLSIFLNLSEHFENYIN